MIIQIKNYKFFYQNNDHNKNLYSICFDDYIDQENKIKFIKNPNISNKMKYINDKMNENKNQSLISDDSNLNNYNIVLREQNSENKGKNGYYYLQNADNKNSSNDNNTTEIINILNDITNDVSHDKEFYYRNHFLIILDDFQNYPNYRLIETISNIENLLFLIQVIIMK